MRQLFNKTAPISQPEMAFFVTFVYYNLNKSYPNFKKPHGWMQSLISFRSILFLNHSLKIEGMYSGHTCMHAHTQIKSHLEVD